MSEHYVSVPEQGGGKLIPDGICNPGQVYTVSRGKYSGGFVYKTKKIPSENIGERWMFG